MQETQSQVSAVQVFFLPSCESPGSVICLFRSMSATFLDIILFSSFFPVLKGRLGSKLLSSFWLNVCGMHFQIKVNFSKMSGNTYYSFNFCISIAFCKGLLKEKFMFSCFGFPLKSEYCQRLYCVCAGAHVHKFSFPPCKSGLALPALSSNVLGNMEPVLMACFLMQPELELSRNTNNCFFQAGAKK